MKKFVKKLVKNLSKKFKPNKIKKHKNFAFYDGTVNDYEGGI